MAWSSPTPITRTPCTHRSGGSNARSEWRNRTTPAVKAYHQLLVWDMMSRPAVTRLAESALNPLVGKSVALYFEKPFTNVAPQ